MVTVSEQTVRTAFDADDRVVLVNIDDTEPYLGSKAAMLAWLDLTGSDAISYRSLMRGIERVGRVPTDFLTPVVHLTHPYVVGGNKTDATVTFGFDNDVALYSQGNFYDASGSSNHPLGHIEFMEGAGDSTGYSVTAIGSYNKRAIDELDEIQLDSHSVTLNDTYNDAGIWKRDLDSPPTNLAGTTEVNFQRASGFGGTWLYRSGSGSVTEPAGLYLWKTDEYFLMDAIEEDIVYHTALPAPSDIPTDSQQSKIHAVRSSDNAPVSVFAHLKHEPNRSYSGFSTEHDPNKHSRIGFESDYGLWTGYLNVTALYEEPFGSGFFKIYMTVSADGDIPREAGGKTVYFREHDSTGNWTHFEVTGGSGGTYSTLDRVSRTLESGKRYVVIIRDDDGGSGSVASAPSADRYFAFPGYVKWAELVDLDEILHANVMIDVLNSNFQLPRPTALTANYKLVVNADGDDYTLVVDTAASAAPLIYDSTHTYQMGDLVLSGSIIWASLTDANLDNTPSDDDTTNWQRLSGEVVYDHNPSSTSTLRPAGSLLRINNELYMSIAISTTTISAIPGRSDWRRISNATGPASWATDGDTTSIPLDKLNNAPTGEGGREGYETVIANGVSVSGTGGQSIP